MSSNAFAPLVSRRDILNTAWAVLAAGAVTRAAEPVVGMIFPRKVAPPAEALTLYPSGVKFLIEGVGLETLTPAGYDSVIDRIVPAAKALAEQGAQAIALMGTSLSFYRGAAFNESLASSIRKATGLPSTTMSSAVVDGLRTLGGRRLAVATAYNDDVNERLRTFLTESGFEVLAMKGLGIERVGDPGKVSQQDLQKFAVGVSAMAPQADAMLLSCGGLRTLEILAPIEAQCRIPVASSMPHALRAAVRLVGHTGASPGFGALLAKS